MQHIEFTLNFSGKTVYCYASATVHETPWGMRHVRDLSMEVLDGDGCDAKPISKHAMKIHGPTIVEHAENLFLNRTEGSS